MKLCLAIIAVLFTLPTYAERRLLVTIAPQATFKADEALFFITDEKETTVTRSLAVLGGSIEGSERRFAAVYRGEAEKISYKAVIVGEKGELLAIGPVSVLTTDLRAFEESETLNPRIAELRSELEARKSELEEVKGLVEKQLAERGEDPIVSKISTVNAKLQILKDQVVALTSELEGRKSVLDTSANEAPRGFQSRLSSITADIQSLAMSAGQVVRAEPKRLPDALARVTDVRALVESTRGESLAALEAEYAKLQKLEPR
jgi:hypothetical protein